MAEQARARRAMIKAGISDTAVNINGINRHPVREFQNSTQIMSVEDLANCSLEDLRAAMDSHNKRHSNSHDLLVGIVQIKNLSEVAFYCKELSFQK